MDLKHIFSQSIVLILIIICYSCNSKSNQARDYLKNAQEHFSKGRLKESTDEISNGLKLDSTICEFYILLSKIKSATNSYDEAIEILNSSSVKNCKQDTIYYLIGNYYFEKSIYLNSRNNEGKLKSESLKTALLYLDSAISKNTFNFDAIVIKQRVFHNLELYDNALETINNALKIFPDSMILIYSSGVEKNYLGDPEGALIDLNRAIESKQLDSKDLAQAYRFRSSIYHDKENLEVAISDLTNSINLDSTNFYSYAERGELFLELGQMDKACNDFRKSASLGYIVIYEKIKESCN